MVPFTQTKEYLSWHEAVGEKAFYKEFFRDISESEDFQIDDENTKEKYAVCASLIIELRIGKVLYVPYGPYFLSTPTEEEKNEVVKYLHDLAKKENCVFVRLETSNRKNKKNSSDLSSPPDHDPLPAEQLFYGHQNSFYVFRPLTKTFKKEGIFQPRMEWWLDLRESEEELLNRIHKDHRYSIRRAEKENIKIEIVSENLENYFDAFWKLLKETGERDGFTLYEENYYKQIFKHNLHGLKKFLVFTKLNEKYMSVALVVISDHIANLVFAGSVSEKRELGFNHLMQWEAFKESKKHGCEIYNFGGITENGYGKQTLEGVTKFKKKFGGYAKFHGDFVDLPIKKVRYFIYILRKMF